MGSRNVSRSSSPTSRSPTKIPKKSSSYRNIPSKIDRVSSAKPKVLPKNQSRIGIRNRTESKRNLNKLEEQSSADLEDEEEDWNEDYSKAHSRREISRTKSRSKNDLTRSEKKTSKSKNSSDSSAKEDRDSGRVHKTSVREKSTQTKKKSIIISDESKDDDILSVTIDATGMPPTTEIISNAAAVMAQPIHVETKLIKSRESLASLQSALSDIGSCRKESTASYDSHGKRFEHQDSVASMVSHNRAPDSTTHTAKASQGSAGHVSKQSSTGSAGHITKQSSQGSAESKRSVTQGSTTHSAKKSSGLGSATAKQSIAALSRISTVARVSTARQSIINRSPEGSVPPSTTHSRTSPRTSAASKRSTHTASATHTPKNTSKNSSLANSPGGVSTISSTSSTTSARSVISNRNFKKISHSIATVSSLSRTFSRSPNRRISQSQSPGSATRRISQSPSPGSASRRESRTTPGSGSTGRRQLGETPLKRVSKAVTSIDRMQSGFGKMPTPDTDAAKVTNKTLMDPSVLVSDPSEKAKQSRTVIVDEIQPIKITVKEKSGDVEVQSGNVSLPRSATNGISQRPV